MIDGVARNRPVAENIRQDIVERADGIPLFVEEITKAVLEAQSEGAAARTIAAVPSPTVAVHASLHASLMARLHRLGPAKAIAQIRAAIGRTLRVPYWLRWRACPSRNWPRRAPGKTTTFFLTNRRPADTVFQNLSTRPPRRLLGAKMALRDPGETKRGSSH